NPLRQTRRTLRSRHRHRRDQPVAQRLMKQDLDENRHQIFKDFGIETRRASAVVLIGHPAVQSNVPEQQINEALRTFNTHVNRVEVITYKELIDNARRSLGDL
ncbi:Shedu anti-phage system protein SduA domain-containing protein, partial [Nonomuraea sp. NPDC049655]|uniref:Shedu anti-phage system protein SduA domain-containing protein n=1 Tax=Nonomuraea sp. NPDC049655 TaxID=3364355 RepID=UPI003793E49D